MKPVVAYLARTVMKLDVDRSGFAFGEVDREMCKILLKLSARTLDCDLS